MLLVTLIFTASTICIAAILSLRMMPARHDPSAFQRFMASGYDDRRSNNGLSGRPVRPINSPPTLSASAAATPEPEPQSVTLRGRMLVERE